MTGEATDLVARLNEAWVETVSPSPEGFRRSMVANVLNEARAAIQSQTGEVTRDWLVSVIQQHTFAQDAADMILAALSQPEAGR